MKQADERIISMDDRPVPYELAKKMAEELLKNIPNDEDSGNLRKEAIEKRRSFSETEHGTNRKRSLAETI
ncbi:hypothetical protein FACS1894111_03910 [Clostridia bacterium]|nr:hypothetical protein FACS1894111_03910 [Clostridia bacterium]